MEAKKGSQQEATTSVGDDRSRKKTGKEIAFAPNKRSSSKVMSQIQSVGDKSEAGQALLRTQSLEEFKKLPSVNYIRSTKSLSSRFIFNMDELISGALGCISEAGPMFAGSSSNQFDLPLAFNGSTTPGLSGRFVASKEAKLDSPEWKNLPIQRALPISLRFQDVKYKVAACTQSSDADKYILHGISGSVHPGEILALIGPSGGGKTTLLNLLSGRFKINFGMITYNNRPYDNSLKQRIGYVFQEDVVFPHLTVKETLIYAALLRLPKDLTNEQKKGRAMNVIYELGLERCQDTIIGSSRVRGVSGGERKRVSIGHEILLNPSLLFLDEPTSGLDSATALRIVQMLEDIAKAGKTVVTTIHQPSSRLFSKFHKLILLGQGSSLYYGKASDAMPYFSSIGCSPLVDMNPAEFLIDLADGNVNDKSIPSELEGTCTPASQRLETHSRKPSPVQVHEYLVGAYEARSVKIQSSNLLEPPRGSGRLGEAPISVDFGATWLEQFCILFTRGFKERRHEHFNLIRITQIIATAIIVGLLWWQISDTSKDRLEELAGLLFFISVFWGFLPLFTAIFTFPQERAMLTKERSVGMYKLSAYFAARISTDLPLDLILPIAFMLIVYFMVGLKLNFTKFCLTMLTIFSSILASQGLGLIIGAAFMDVKKGSTFASVILMTLMLSSGFFIQDVPRFMSCVRYVSFNYHTYRLLLKIHSSCPLDSSKICSTPSVRGMKVDSGGTEAIALITMVVGYRLIAYLFLKRMKLRATN